MESITGNYNENEEDRLVVDKEIELQNGTKIKLLPLGGTIYKKENSHTGESRTPANDIFRKSLDREVHTLKSISPPKREKETVMINGIRTKQTLRNNFEI